MSPMWHAVCSPTHMMERMKLGVAVWNGRVSPVFDTARHLLALEVEDGQVVLRLEQDMGTDEPIQKAARLAELGIETLVCGAVSRPLAELIAARGIRLIPFVAGGTDEVITAFLAGALPSQNLSMPGCCGRRMRHRGGVGRHGCGRSRRGRLGQGRRR